MREYCTQNNGECETCSLSSYGRDCANNIISPSPSTIRTTRLALGLTQSQAGAVVGASARTWRAWEAGVRVMPGAKWELFLIKTREVEK